MKPEAVLVTARGEWLLFRSTKPQLPLMSPDVPAPLDQETILDRVKQILVQRAGTAAPPP